MGIFTHSINLIIPLLFLGLILESNSENAPNKIQDDTDQADQRFVSTSANITAPKSALDTTTIATNFKPSFSRKNCEDVTKEELTNTVFFSMTPANKEKLLWFSSFYFNFSEIITKYIQPNECKNMENRDLFTVTPDDLHFVNPSPTIFKNTIFAVFYITEKNLKTNVTDIIPKTLILDCLDEAKTKVAVALGNVVINRIEGTFPYSFKMYCQDYLLMKEDVVSEKTMIITTTIISVLAAIFLTALVVLVIKTKTTNYNTQHQKQTQQNTHVASGSEFEMEKVPLD